MLNSTNGEDVSEVPNYGRHFSFDELLAHRCDLVWLRRGIRNVDVSRNARDLPSVIQEKESNVRAMATSIRKITERTLSRYSGSETSGTQQPDAWADVQFTVDVSRGSTILAAMPYVSEAGARGSLRVWLPELGKKDPEELPRALLHEPLQAKLRRILYNAVRILNAEG